MEKERIVIVAIHQPQYLPWLGYFDKIAVADAFCCLDSVQYKKSEWQNRNRLKTARGWQWVTVPVRYRFGQTIDTVAISQQERWAEKHLRALSTHYGKAPFFKDYFPFFQKLYARRWHMLAEVNINVIKQVKTWLGLSAKPFFRSSEMEGLSDDPTGRLVDICRRLGADAYLAGRDGAVYMDLAQFERAGISVRFQDYRHPVYSQLFGPFLPCMSVVDLLFNHGPDSLKILRRGGAEGAA